MDENELDDLAPESHKRANSDRGHRGTDEFDHPSKYKDEIDFYRHAVGGGKIEDDDGDDEDPRNPH